MFFSPLIRPIINPQDVINSSSTYPSGANSHDDNSNVIILLAVLGGLLFGGLLIGCFILSTIRGLKNNAKVQRQCSRSSSTASGGWCQSSSNKRPSTGTSLSTSYSYSFPSSSSSTLSSSPPSPGVPVFVRTKKQSETPREIRRQSRTITKKPRSILKQPITEQLEVNQEGRSQEGKGSQEGERDKNTKIGEEDHIPDPKEGEETKQPPPPGKETEQSKDKPKPSPNKTATIRHPGSESDDDKADSSTKGHTWSEKGKDKEL